MSSIVVAALYKFVSLPDYEQLREPLQQLFTDKEIFGTLLLAEEGINGTVASSREGIDALLAHLKSDPRMAELEHKESYTDKMPFLRQKVRLKKEIVTMGVPGTDPNQKVGQYATPEQWNELIKDPEVLVVDTRNQYEVDIGTFKNAVSPETDTFREFPDYVQQNLDPEKHKKVAMFCTGGIRCEKASSYMLNQGFDEVYHLKGGILKYLEEAPEENLWEGECFVFDERVTVDGQLEPGKYQQCNACRHPISDEDMASPLFEKGVSCPHCHDQVTPEQRARFAERQKQIELAKQRDEQHIGPNSSARRRKDT